MVGQGDADDLPAVPGPEVGQGGQRRGLAAAGWSDQDASESLLGGDGDDRPALAKLGYETRAAGCFTVAVMLGR